MKAEVKKIIAIVISIFTVICLNINLEVVNTLEECFSTFQITDIAYIILYYLIFLKIIDIENRRAKICCSILAIIFRIV